jgi:hypothetical protein
MHAYSLLHVQSYALECTDAVHVGHTPGLASTLHRYHRYHNMM